MSQLVKYEAACRAIAECIEIDEVKSWADKAAAMQAYQRMAGDKTMEVNAAEIRIRAERRLGELISAQKADGGLNQGARMAGKKYGSSAVVTDDRRPKLSDAGISKDLSSRAQKLAAVPEKEFEREVGEWRERVSAEGKRVTARLEAAGARELKKTDKQREADRIADEAHGDFDPVAELEQAQKDIERLQAELAATEADDLKAEALKWRRAYDAAVRGQSEAMDRAKQATDREAWTMRQLRRCGKAVGQDDPTKIAAAVEAIMRRAA